MQVDPIRERQEVTATGMRRVRTVTTRGIGIEFQFRNGIEWKELKAMLLAGNVQLSGMKVVEGRGRTTLEHPQAVVPDGDLDLFIMPVRSKGGVRPVKKVAKKTIKKVAKKAPTKVVPKKVVKKAAKKGSNKTVKRPPIETTKRVSKPKPKPKPKTVERAAPMRRKTPEELQAEFRQLRTGFDDVLQS